MGGTRRLRYRKARPMKYANVDQDHDPDTRGETLFTLDEMLDKVGDGKYQWWLLSVCALSFGADSCEVTLLSFLSACVGSEWGLGKAAASSLAAVVFAGELLGAFFWGYIADKYGRRPAYLVAVFVVMASGVASAAAPDYKSLILLRGCVGFGIGGLFVPFDLLSEFVRPQHRGRSLTVVWYIWTIGATLVIAAAAWLLPKEAGWRYLALVCAVPTALSAVTLPWLPESPRWLLSCGRGEEAMAILRTAAVVNGRRLLPGARLIHEDHCVRSDAGVSELWRGAKRCRITVAAWALWFLFGLGYFGIVLLSGRVFKVANKPASGESCAFDYGNMAVVALSELVGTTVLAAVIDDYGRRASQAWAYLLTALAVVPLGYTVSRRAATVLSFVARAAIMAATSATWVHLPEVYATEIRGKAHAAANAWSRVGAFVSPFLIDSTMPLSGVTTGLAAAFAASAALALCMPETAGRGIDELTAEAPASCGGGDIGDPGVLIGRDGDKSGAAPSLEACGGVGGVDGGGGGGSSGGGGWRRVASSPQDVEAY